MTLEKLVEGYALPIAMALIVTLFLVGLYLFAGPAKSQGIEIGPGGVYVSPGRSRGQECAELRRMCQYRGEDGERDEESCHRYRNMCRWDR